jgi:hypothetical protein
MFLSDPAITRIRALSWLAQSPSIDVSSRRFGRLLCRSKGRCSALSLHISSLAICLALLSSAFGQVPFTTSRGDNARDGANASETVLTPTNVNLNSFGHLLSIPVDYVVMAQPLYMPKVKIGKTTHNVVYVVTQADSVYAIDADTGAQFHRSGARHHYR